MVDQTAPTATVDLDAVGGDLASGEAWAVERYSKSQVVAAGKLIGGSHPTHTPELIDAYNVAHAWRRGHLEPMRRVRRSLSQCAAGVDWSATTAGRLKRFQSIRRKLKGGRLTLYQMQDIAGVRAIMRDMDAVRRVAAIYAGGSKHPVIKQNDYIAAPKADGYRSHHIVMRFDGSAEITGDNRIAVELQVRTRLQHAWATAVEAVGLVRGENLKAGLGDADWLRFFALMSSEFAIEEGEAVVPGISTSDRERRAELSDVVAKLDAVAMLESYNLAIRGTEDFFGLRGNSYVIQYDAEAKKISVKPVSRFSRTSEEIFNDEVLNNQPNTVLVEVDKVDDLRAAYPNYFLDVKMFTERLRGLIGARRGSSLAAFLQRWTAPARRP